ncbi:MAG: endolytic transglycosylase MltG, partial [Longimicrobiales bacterium]
MSCNRLSGSCVAALLVLALGCSGAGSGEPVRVHVPNGASFSQVADSLAAKDIVRAAPLFKLYARATGDAGRVKPGTYAFREGSGWKTVLASLVSGDVLTERVVIPEGWNLAGIAPRIAAV